jgi:hypothetical protein
MSWSDFLVTESADEDQSAADDATEADSYLGAVEEDIAEGYDPSGDLDDAAMDLGNASDAELDAADLSADAVDAEPVDDVCAGGGDVWDPAEDA